MKNPELFNKTISILVKAYFDGYLEACDCAACAVGNLVSANLNYKRIGACRYIDQATGSLVYSSWEDIVWALKGERILKLDLVEAKKQVESTGYTAHQLLEIEKSFMTDELFNVGNFERLMRVVDCLMIIHEATETEITESKSLFIKQKA